MSRAGTWAGYTPATDTAAAAAAAAASSSAPAAPSSPGGASSFNPSLPWMDQLHHDQQSADALLHALIGDWRFRADGARRLAAEQLLRLTMAHDDDQVADGPSSPRRMLRQYAAQAESLAGGAGNANVSGYEPCLSKGHILNGLGRFLRAQVSGWYSLPGAGRHNADSLAALLIPTAAASLNAAAALNPAPNSPRITSANAAAAAAEASQNALDAAAASVRSTLVPASEELFLTANLSQPQAREALEKTMGSTLNLFIELTSVWLVVLRERIARCTPPSLASAKQAATLDAREIEATLVSWLCAEQSSVRWDIFRALRGLRALEQALQPHMARVSASLDLDEELPLESDDAVGRLPGKSLSSSSSSARPLRVCFIDVMERCKCLTKGLELTGENVLSNTSCAACVLPDASAACSEAEREAEEQQSLLAVEIDPCQDVPLHLADASNLRQESWSVYFAHLLRALLLHASAEADPAASLASRLHVRAEERLQSLQRKFDEITGVRAYWKKRLAWSFSAAIAKAMRTKPAHILPRRGEEALSEEEHANWRNLLILSGISYSALQMQGASTIPAQKSYFLSRFVSLLGNGLPTVRRSAIMALGNLDLAVPDLDTAPAATPTSLVTSLVDASGSGSVVSTVSVPIVSHTPRLGIAAPLLAVLTEIQERMRGAPAGPGPSAAAASSASSSAATSSHGVDGACHVFLPSPSLCATPGSDFPHSHLAHDLDSETLVATHTEPTPVSLSPEEVDRLRVDLSVVYKMLVAQLESPHLLLPSSRVQLSHPLQAQTHSIVLLIRSYILTYILGAYALVTKSHPHNEFRWDFIELRCNLAKIIARVARITTEEAELETDVAAAATDDSAADQPTPTTPLLSDPQRKLLFEMLLAWCGHGPSSAAYAEKFKAHSAELLGKIGEKQRTGRKKRRSSGSAAAAANQALKAQLTVLVEQLKILSLQGMAALLRGKCFDPHLQAQLNACSSGAGWDMLGSGSSASSSTSAASVSYGQPHDPSFAAASDHKGTVFPWLNSLLVSSRPTERDIAYTALESFILHNEHLLYQFITSCYVVQAGSSVISKRYFQTIGNILWKQAMAIRERERERTKAVAQGKPPPTYTGAPPRMLKLPLSVLLHLLIFKLGDLSFSVRAMALRLIPVMDHFYGAERARITSAAQAAASSPRGKKGAGASVPPTPPLQVVVGSHLPDTFRAMQLQLSAHFASLYPSESLSVFNECGRRVMFLHSLRMGAAAGSSSSGTGSAASFSLHSIGAGGNSVHINNQIEDNIKNMMAYLAPWLAHIQLAPPSLLSIAQSTFAYANSAAGELPVSPMIGRNNRSLRTYSVLTAKKGPLEVMHQLLDFTFLFSASIIPPSAAGNVAAAQAAASASASGADAASAGNSASTLSIHTSPAPYSVPSSLLQGLFTHLVRGHADADHAQGCSSDSDDDDDDDERDRAPNSNLEHLVLFLFERMTLAQAKGRLTPEWKICFQRVALYLSRIEPDQTLRCIIGQLMASTAAASVAAAGEAKSLATQSAASSSSKALLTKANFAIMLLPEIAYELDLGGDEMPEPAAGSAAATSLNAAAKSSSSSSKKPPSVAEQKYPSRNELSVPSPSTDRHNRTSGGGKRRSAGRGGSFGGLKAVGTSIRVRQPLDTVALLLHIGLLGLHYPATSAVAPSSPEQAAQQSHVSNFVRRHATELLINLIQATVFHTSEQLHPEKLRVRNPDRGFVPAAGVAPGPARSMLFMHQADVCAAHVDSDWEGEDAASDDDFPGLGSAVLSSFASQPLSASSRHFAQSNSKHTLNLALAPLQLAPPPKDVLAAAAESKEEAENSDAAGTGGGAQSTASRAQVRESKALKLINDLNQYLGWILCHRSNADAVSAVASRSVRGMDSEAALDSCPVPGLDFQSLLPNLLRIMPARIRLRAPLLQKWWRLTAEWSNKCNNDAHCRAGSLRLMQLMACSILPPVAGETVCKPLPAKPAVELKDLLSLMDRAESDLNPWISHRDDESKNVAPPVLPPLSSASAAPFVLAQNLSTIQSVLFALVARDRAQGFVSKSAKTLYSSALPRLFCLCVQTVVSQSTLNDAELLKPRPKLAGSVTLQALEFLAGMVELVAAQASEGAGHRAKLPRAQRGNPDVEPLPSAKQLVQHIGLFYLESSNVHGSSSSAARNKHPFPSLLILIQQMLKANVPVTAVSSVDAPASSSSAAAGSASPDRSATLVLFTKDIDAAACAQNSQLLARTWAVLARLAPFSLVNDEERTVVAPLIDFGFVAQQQQMRISPALAPDSETLLHPFLLNLCLQLPAWCLSLRAPPAVSPAWHLVAAFVAQPPSPPFLLPAQEDLARKAGRALGEIALAFGLGHLSSLLRQFGAGEFHRASAMHAALHGASAPHAQFLAEIAPLLVECVGLTVAPKLLHVLLDCIVSVSTWLPTPAKVAAAPVSDNTSTPAPKKKKVKQGGLSRLFSSSKKRRSSGEKRAAAAIAAAAAVASAAASAAPAQFVSQFHAQTQLVLFELVCALLTRVQWPQVEAQAAAASKASVASASSAAAEAKASADAASGGAMATSEEVHAVFARFEALAVWPELAPKVHATLRLFAPGAAATSPLAHVRSRAHSQAYLLVAQPGANVGVAVAGHHPPPRLPLQQVQMQVQAVPFPSLSPQTESPPVKHTRKRSSLRSQQQQPQATSPAHGHVRGSSNVFAGPPLSPNAAGTSGRKSVGFSRDVQINGSSNGAAASPTARNSGAYMHPSLLASSPSRRSLFADPSTVPELGELERGGSQHSNSSTYTYIVSPPPRDTHQQQQLHLQQAAYQSRDEEKENIQQHINGQLLMHDQDADASHSQQQHEDEEHHDDQENQHDESEVHDQRQMAGAQSESRRENHQVSQLQQQFQQQQLQQQQLQQQQAQQQAQQQQQQPVRSTRRSAVATAALDLLSSRSLAQHDASSVDVHASRSLQGTTGSRGSGGSSTSSTASRGSLGLTGTAGSNMNGTGTGSASQFGSAGSDLAARMIEETAARKASIQQARRDRFNERWKKLKPETEAAAAMAGAMNSAAAAHGPSSASSSLASSRLGEMRNVLGGVSLRGKK